MSNSYTYRRGSLFGPLVLIALGVLFLLHDHIPGLDLYESFARYWPVLLILWGLVRLVEHYSATPGTQRAGLSGGEVVLLFLAIVIGLSLTASLRLRHSDFGREMGIQFWDSFERSYPFTAQTQAPLPPGAAVVVRGLRGDVELIAGSGDDIAVSVRDEVHGDSEADASALFGRSQPIVRQEGGQVLVLPAGADPDPKVEADLRLVLPPTTPAIVQTDHGDVRVGHWKANLDLTTGHGDITVSNNAGDLRVHASHGDLTLQGITGRLQVDGSGGDLSVADVSGHVIVNGDYTGDLTFSGLPRGLEFSSSRTQLSLAALPGALDLDMGDLHAQSVSELHVQTEDKDIAIRQFQGALRVDDAHGSVSATASEAPSQTIQLGNRDGDISLVLPAASRFQLDASARQGSITSDFNIAPTQNDALAEAHATVGSGGPTITLTTSNGAIAIRKLALAAATPEP